MKTKHRKSSTEQEKSVLIDTPFEKIDVRYLDALAGWRQANERADGRAGRKTVIDILRCRCTRGQITELESFPRRMVWDGRVGGMERFVQYIRGG